eukprot:Opistho-2@58893
MAHFDQSSRLRPYELARGKELRYTNKPLCDYFPQVDGQLEDSLSPKNISEGFPSQPPVAEEHSSARSKFRQSHKEQAFAGLRVLSDRSFAQGVVCDGGPAVALSASGQALPDAVSIGNIRFSASALWSKDGMERLMRHLATPGYALAAIEKLPMYKKKRDLFEVIADNSIPIPRASWFVKVTMFGEKAPPRPDPNEAILEFTVGLCEYMGSLIAEIPSDVSAISDGKKHSLVTCLSRFRFSTRLFGWMYEEGTVHRDTALRWMCDVLRTATGPRQTGLVASLVLPYAQEMSKSNTFASLLLAETTSKLRLIADAVRAEDDIGRKVARGSIDAMKAIGRTVLLLSPSVVSADVLQAAGSIEWRQTCASLRPQHAEADAALDAAIEACITCHVERVQDSDNAITFDESGTPCTLR